MPVLYDVSAVVSVGRPSGGALGRSSKSLLEVIRASVVKTSLVSLGELEHVVVPVALQGTEATTLRTSTHPNRRREEGSAIGAHVPLPATAEIGFFRVVHRTSAKALRQHRRVVRRFRSRPQLP